MKAKVCLRKTTSLLVAATMLVSLPSVQALAADRSAPLADFTYTQDKTVVSTTTGGEVKLWANVPTDREYRGFVFSVNYDEAATQYGCTGDLTTSIDATNDGGGCAINQKGNYDSNANKPSYTVAFNREFTPEASKNLFECTLNVPAGVPAGTTIKILANKNIGITGVNPTTGRPQALLSHGNDPKYRNDDVTIWTIEVSEGAPAPTEANAQFAAKDDSTGTLTVDEADVYKYSTNDGKTWTDIAGTSADVTGLNNGSKIMVVKKGDGVDALDSLPMEINVTKPDIPSVRVTKCTEGKEDGKITGVDNTMEYRAKGATEWTPVNGSEITGLAAGKYEVRIKANGTALASAPATPDITAGSSGNGGSSSGGNGRKPAGTTPESTEPTSRPTTSNPNTEPKGEPDENPFVDVHEGDYYYDPVLWANKNGVAYGVDATHYAPMIGTERAQMVTFLWRASGSPEPTSNENPFVDVAPGSYYYKAVLWGYENGYVAGTSKETFSPNVTVTRGQAVTFLARMAGVTGYEAGYTHPFTDVSAKDYYNNAVSYAYSNGIAVGTTATTFSPKSECTRGQIVTFLYRYFVK